MWSVGRLFVILLTLNGVSCSVFSGADGICSLEECSCRQDTVICRCKPESSFQESFVFIDEARKLQKLTVENCPKLRFPSQSLSIESRLVKLEVKNVSNVEFQAESVVITSLRELTITDAESVVFRQHSLVSGFNNSPMLNITVTHIQKLEVEDKAFSSLHSFKADHINDAKFNRHAFKLKVPTEVPTISIILRRIKAQFITSSVFSSSFKSVQIIDSEIGRIFTNAFSGLIINHIKLEGVSIQRIERNAFSDSSAIGILEFLHCNISSMSQKSIVAGISTFILSNSEIQSITKHGSINATVANVIVTNNRFKTLSQESVQFVAWDSVIIQNNTIDFLEQGAINAIKMPSQEITPTFTFAENFIGNANTRSLLTQIPMEVSISVFNNTLGHRCDCELNKYIRSITGQSDLSSPFFELAPSIRNTSSCKVSKRDRPCFKSKFTPINTYLSHDICDKSKSDLPLCARPPDEEVSFVPISAKDDILLTNDTNYLVKFYEEFLLLFQVKTTKGILLFLLFCVLTSIITLSICVGIIWIHRLCRQAKLVRDNLSGSFQFNSGDEKQILYGSDQTTCHSLPGDEEEPTYAEIADIHPPPKFTGDNSCELSAQWTTLPMQFPRMNFDMESSGTMSTTLPSIEANTLPIRTGEFIEKENTECTSLLSDSELDNHAGLETTQVTRLSMSETSLTDEIMMALRDKLSDPNLYMSVLDARPSINHTTSTAKKPGTAEEEVYCSPLYSDPLQLSPISPSK